MTQARRARPPSAADRIAYGELEEPVDIGLDDARLEDEARALASRATAAQLAVFLDGADALADEGDEAWAALVERFAANRMDAVRRLRRMRRGMADIVGPRSADAGEGDADPDSRWSRAGRRIRDFLDNFGD